MGSQWKDGSPGPTPGWNPYPGPGTYTQAQGSQEGPRKCVPFPMCQSYSVESQLSQTPWTSCSLILRSPVLGPAPQKSRAGHSAESSETCGQAAVMQRPHHWPAGVSYRPFRKANGLRGCMHPDLEVCEIGACAEPWLWNQKGWTEEGDSAQSMALQGL